jgi:hypothetical protein
MVLIAAVAGVGLAGSALPAGASMAFGPIALAWPHAVDGPLRLTVAALIGIAVTTAQRRGERSEARRSLVVDFAKPRSTTRHAPSIWRRLPAM